MKRLILILISGLIIALLAFRFIDRGDTEEILTIEQMQAIKGFPVEVATVKLQPFRQTKLYTGTVAGGEETEVSSVIGEYISQVHVKEGDRVRKDQLIAELSRDNPVARYKTARLALDNAEVELSRIQKLFEQGAVSQQTLDLIMLQRDMAQEGLKNAESLLLIKAPFDGIVTKLTAESGKFATPMLSLATIVSEEAPRVKISIPAGDREYVKTGLKCFLSSGNNIAEGQIDRIALSANTIGRSFTAWVTIDSQPAGFSFSPGLMVDVDVAIVDKENALTIPLEALQREGSKWSVFVVKDDHVRLSVVELGGRDSQSGWVKTGLNAGDVVVLRGAERLQDDAVVRIINHISQQPDETAHETQARTDS